MTRFGSAYETVQPARALHWILQGLLLIRAYQSPYFWIEKDAFIRKNVLARCIHLSFKISGLKIPKLQLELHSQSGCNPENAYVHPHNEPKQEISVAEKTLPSDSER